MRCLVLTSWSARLKGRLCLVPLSGQVKSLLRDLNDENTLNDEREARVSFARDIDAVLEKHELLRNVYTIQALQEVFS